MKQCIRCKRIKIDFGWFTSFVRIVIRGGLYTNIIPTSVCKKCRKEIEHDGFFQYLTDEGIII